MRCIKSILCITIVFFSSYMLPMSEVDVHGEDPYRFGEIIIDEPLSERDLESRLKKVAHGDHNYPIRRILIAQVVRLQLVDFTPDRYMYEAVLFNDYWLVKYLLDHGADADAKDMWDVVNRQTGGCPIILRAQSKPIAKLLVQHNVDLSVKGYWGTILHYCHDGNYSAELMSYYIKEHRLDVNAQEDSVGCMAQGTPLHHLVCYSSSGSDESIMYKAKILVSAGADLRATTKDGFTPYDIIERDMGFNRFSPSCRAQLLALLNPDNQSDFEHASYYNTYTQNQE